MNTRPVKDLRKIEDTTIDASRSSEFIPNLQMPRNNFQSQQSQKYNPNRYQQPYNSYYSEPYPHSYCPTDRGRGRGQQFTNR